MIQELAPEQLRRSIQPDALGFDTTESLQPLSGIIGQQRAVSALQFGLGMQKDGFHIYVAGPAGIGKMTAVESFLEQFAKQKSTPSDWCYVNNFEDPYQPKYCRLPPGAGRQFQQDMKNMIDGLRSQLPKAFESDGYGAKRDEITKALGKQREVVIERVNDQAAQAGFLLQFTPTGVAMTPVLSGHALTDAEFQALPIPARDEFRSRREALQDSLKEDFKQLHNLERAAQESLQELDRQIALYIVGELVDGLQKKYSGIEDISEYLKEMQKDILQNIEPFKTGGAGAEEGVQTATPWSRELPFHKYDVNVLVNNSRTQGAPVVVALNPSYTNLFGRVEKETQYGSMYTDFTMVKPGALHRANGGYLVLPIEDTLGQYASWDSLKRALRSGQIMIEEIGERLGFLSTKTVQPQPIPLDIKIVLVGPANIYYWLHEYDSEFPELFKVKADFETTMPCDEHNIADFLAFVSTLCQRENLRHPDKTGAARLLEQAMRLAEDQQKLSTHFGAIANLIRESDYWAGQEQAATISAAHVRKALAEKEYRASLLQDRSREMVLRGTLLIDTSGEMVGQINGLSVISLGDYEFGRPTRITATVEPGSGGIVDIERQVALGGPIHSKGVYILDGYLAQRYGKERVVSLSARLVFEQSYGTIDGDSASSAELYTLLSVLADLPIKQSIAVTGSVNQHGHVQAIGGVNQKIEGFFDLCNARGLTGAQGVIIPQSNMLDLMLREEVIDAVKSGQFHVWAVSNIDEGVELLTGVPAGERTPNGRYPESTVNARVDQRLRDLADPPR
ncbi:MAG: AAA family ATPase [Chloroflexi bacterium]|nr:AAA family ATPase [Chloroflexota bacterium]MCL5274254.1 AAA family ATPase [Chloroflexota bacterium]